MRYVAQCVPNVVVLLYRDAYRQTSDKTKRLAVPYNTRIILILAPPGPAQALFQIVPDDLVACYAPAVRSHARIGIFHIP